MIFIKNKLTSASLSLYTVILVRCIFDVIYDTMRKTLKNIRRQQSAIYFTSLRCVQMHNAHLLRAAKWSSHLDVINSLLHPLVIPFAPYSSNGDQHTLCKRDPFAHRFPLGGFAAHFLGCAYCVAPNTLCTQPRNVYWRLVVPDYHHTEKRGAIKGSVSLKLIMHDCLACRLFRFFFLADALSIINFRHCMR